ncbi:MAG TPA: 4-hydroxy-tetrahydrodipicolinate synthase [Solirubrobacteraceae bacterium]|jgi:4-hydroxy-tetrahydrodipicolinate synthase|nr:4-hydroxy-tetrahydrodipicolinate synthase [Solirubrobacteraceae bacterium]
MRPLEGLLTAMVTPFRPDGSINEDGAVALGRHLLSHGSDGLVVCGTTGESPTLSDDEMVSLVETMVAELAGEARIAAGAGSNSTHHACHLAERMAATGAHALLSVTGYYNRPNRRGIVRHYEEVARAAGGTPIIVYNIPSRTTVNIAPDLLAELAQIDGIAAVKQSNSAELGPIDGLTLFTGNDEDLARCLDLGGAGGICVSSHVVGTEMRRMFDEPERRREIDASLHDVFKAMFCTSSPIPVKTALNLLGHDVGGLRLPLVDPDEHELATVRTALERHNLLTGVHAA